MQQVLENLVCVNLGITIWSGLRRISKTDFAGNIRDELPPDELVSWGSKRLIDPALLSPFYAIRLKTDRYLKSVGTRFLGGYAIPKGLSDEAFKKLGEMKKQFERNIDDFVRNYDTNVSDWVSRFPEWDQVIRDAVLTAEQVRNRFAFSWQAFEVNPPQQQEAVQGLVEEVTAMPRRVLEEIAEVSETLFERSFQGKAEVSRRSLGPLRKISRKLRSMGFVTPKFWRVAALIDRTLDGLPPKGPISGSDLQRIFGLLFILSDPIRMNKYAESEAKGNEPELQSCWAGLPPQDADGDVDVDVDGDDTTEVLLQEEADEVVVLVDNPPPEDDEPDEEESVEEPKAAFPGVWF